MRKRPSGSLLISIALHIVLGAGLLWVLAIPYDFQNWLFPAPPEQERPVESLTYVELPRAGSPAGTPAGGGGPSVTPRRRPPLVAPSSVPTSVPRATPEAQPVPPAAGGTGTGEGGASLRKGITPSFDDPRVWLPPGEARGAPRSPAERLDSALVSTLRVHQDSMNAIAAAQGRKPGDWTFEKGGKKWGMDSRNIYIGDHSIPTAILALLPLNSGSNPVKNRQERDLNFQRKEILEQSQRAMNEEEFREAVKKIRERKEREHEAEQARKKAVAEKPIP